MKNQSKMAQLSPALGLIFGTSLGLITGVLLNQNMALFAGAGAGVGLVIGAIIFSIMGDRKSK